MSRADDHIRTLAAEVRAAFDAAGVAIERFSALQPGRKIRAANAWLTWADWLQSPDGVAYVAVCEAFEAAADRLIEARPVTLVGYCEKIEALTLADLDQDDIDRLTEERRAIIAAEEGGAP